MMGSLPAYLQMTKPTISLLVAFTVLPTLFMAEALPELSLVLLTLLGTYMASSSSAVFNHLVDADVDSAMQRTSKRPLPSGVVSPVAAVVLATVLGVLSFWLLYALVNPLTAWIALAANFFYVVIYTIWLKRRTVQNIVIGGAAGAVGPLLGAAAVTGTLTWEAWVLFLIIFLWTPPHFWALALKYKDDYSAAKIPMLPSVYGEEVTRKQILIYTLLLVPTVLSLYVFGSAGLLYLIVALAASGYFCWLAWVLYRRRDVKHAMPVFLFSLLYIFALFGALAVETFMNHWQA